MLYIQARYHQMSMKIHKPMDTAVCAELKEFMVLQRHIASSVFEWVLFFVWVLQASSTS